MNRRRFLSTLCLSVGLVACKGGEKAPEQQAGGEPAPKAAQTEKIVNLYTWPDYFTPQVLEEFTKATGITVRMDTYDSNESLQGKLQAGATGYDVILPSDYMVTIMAKGGLVQALDPAKIPNMQGLDTSFRSPTYDPGNRYSVPFQWGTSGIGYLPDKVGVEINSWSQLLKPDDKFKGRISMLKDVRECFAAAHKLAGKSVNTTDPADIEAAKKVLAAQGPAVKLFTSDNYKEQLAQGEVWMAHGWSSIIALAKFTLNPNIKFVVPKEGAIVWVDNLSIPKGAPNVENAYTFINYFMEPKNNAAISNSTYGNTPVLKAREFIRPELLNDPALYPPVETMQRLEYLSDIGEATRKYDEAWTELRAQ